MDTETEKSYAMEQNSEQIKNIILQLAQWESENKSRHTMPIGIELSDGKYRFMPSKLRTGSDCGSGGVPLGEEERRHRKLYCLHTYKRQNNLRECSSEESEDEEYAREAGGKE